MDYVKELQRIIKENEGFANFVTIINKDGVVEYIDNIGNDNVDFKLLFVKSMLGRNILDIYGDTLSEENSTTYAALKTGKIVTADKQRISAGGVTLIHDARTYPLFDENGEVMGAVDVTHLLQYFNNDPVKQGEEELVLGNIITRNPKMIEIKDVLPGIAAHESPVFIYGETGTGKELFAKAIHDLSDRSNGPFVSQNCAAIPETLIESTFFGTDRGGFTGAEVKKGLFEMADGGTLFLDEVNSMPISMQSKLLKALEEEKIRKIGGEHDIPVNIRLICASNEKPQELMEKGLMRADFYYRVSVANIVLPPLRERPEDIDLLVDHFIKMFNERTGKNIKGLSEMTRDVIRGRDWPGNIRELKSTIESAFNYENSSVITLNSIKDIIDEDDVKVKQNDQSDGAMKEDALDDNQLITRVRNALVSLDRGEHIDTEKLLESCEREMIIAALRNHRKKADVAKSLSMSPQKLNYKLNKMNIKVK